MVVVSNVGRGKLPISIIRRRAEFPGDFLMECSHSMKPCAFSGPVFPEWSYVVDENGKSVRDKWGLVIPSLGSE